MVIAVWVVKIILAFIFGMAGAIKLSQPKAKLEERMTYTQDFTEGQVRLIGLLEVLAALGLILPPLVGVLPQLAGWAAAGLVLVMIGAIVTHLRRNETGAIGMNVVLLISAAFVAGVYFGVFA